MIPEDYTVRFKGTEFLKNLQYPDGSWLPESDFPLTGDKCEAGIIVSTEFGVIDSSDRFPPARTFDYTDFKKGVPPSSIWRGRKPKPDETTSYEFGLDGALWAGRVAFSIDYYAMTTKVYEFIYSKVFGQAPNFPRESRFYTCEWNIPLYDNEGMETGGSFWQSNGIRLSELEEYVLGVNAINSAISAMNYPDNTGVFYSDNRTYIKDVSRTGRLYNKGLTLSAAIELLNYPSLSLSTGVQFHTNRTRYKGLTGPLVLSTMLYPPITFSDDGIVRTTYTWCEDSFSGDNPFPAPDSKCRKEVSTRINPDWELSLSPKLRWKQVSLSALLEHSQGGSVYDGTKGTMLTRGWSLETTQTFTNTTDQPIPRSPYRAPAMPGETVRGKIFDFGYEPSGRVLSFLNRVIFSPEQKWSFALTLHNWLALGKDGNDFYTHSDATNLGLKGMPGNHWFNQPTTRSLILSLRTSNQ